MCCAIATAILTLCLQLLNGILGISGFILAILSGFAFYYGANVPLLKEISSQNLSAMSLFLGMMLIGLSILGYIAFMMKSSTLFMIYSCILVIVIVVQVIATSVLIDERELMIKKFQLNVQTMYEKGDDTYHALHVFLHCCGPYGAKGYPPFSIPRTCCNMEKISLFCNPLDAYEEGCVTKGTQLLRNITQAYLISNLAFLIFEATTLAFSCCISHQYKSGQIPFIRVRA